MKLRQACLRPSLFMVILALILTNQAWALHDRLPNRIAEPAPYLVEEAKAAPPPYDHYWSTINDPSLCATCHQGIFAEWDGSMMANSWRDPAWRGAFLLVSRLTATDGNCDVPDPPDGTPKAKLNPFATEGCSSTFNLGSGTYTTHGSGSLLDDLCSRCHMPANYVDQFPLDRVQIDPAGMEYAVSREGFDPTSDNGTGVSFARVQERQRNTRSGQLGISCAICHTQVQSRYTPYHVYPMAVSAPEGTGASGSGDLLGVPDPALPNLGYAIGTGAFKLSPAAITAPIRFGPLTRADDRKKIEPYLSEVFKQEINYQKGEFTLHPGFYHALFERGEHCGACHDVTNPLTLKNPLGKWVGGFPIERTYSEWLDSRYADRPGNRNYDPDFKRDCQTCHMQQDFGKPGTAQVLYREGLPLPPLASQVTAGGPQRKVFFSHHFIGGNTYVTGLAGSTMAGAEVAAWPELSAYSYSSADPKSPYHNAYWLTDKSGAPTQHARLAWDRLRNVVGLELKGAALAKAGGRVPLEVTVVNEGAGHKFPTGFPEGRNAWVALHAVDLATGQELSIFDQVWQRTAPGIGDLTDRELTDPNFPGCNWTLPAGSPDPFAYQFRAVASLGDGCPTLALPFATPLNLVVNAAGLPIDADGSVINNATSLGTPQYRDLDGDGDLYDDNFLIDTRLRPLPHPGATVKLDRYAVVIPPGTRGPVAVTATVYYQSMEALAALKFLGNLADTDLDFKLEPGVLKGLQDGRKARTEPAVVEGAPPVPMAVRNWVINIAGAMDEAAPRISTYPADGATAFDRDGVIKAFFSEPVTGLNPATFTLYDAGKQPLPAFVDQIGDGVWALFPHRVFLNPGEKYTARLAAPICDFNGNCTDKELSWSFTVAAEPGDGQEDTRIPAGFLLGGPR